MQAVACVCPPVFAFAVDWVTVAVLPAASLTTSEYATVPAVSPVAKVYVHVMVVPLVAHDAAVPVVAAAPTVNVMDPVVLASPAVATTVTVEPTFTSDWVPEETNVVPELTVAPTVGTVLSKHI